MLVSYVVTVFHFQKEGYTLTLWSGVQAWIFSPDSSGQYILKAKKAQKPGELVLHGQRGHTENPIPGAYTTF